MYGICLRYGHDYSTAEDLLQEVFIKAIRTIKEGRYNELYYAARGGFNYHRL